MKIQEIAAFPLRIPYKMPAHIASIEYQYAETVLVKITTDDGYAGFGEAVTGPELTGENAESITSAIRSYIGPPIIGSNPFSSREIHDKMDNALVRNAAAKAAIDTACLDIIGKVTGQAAYHLLGGDFNSEIFEVPEILLDRLPDDVKYCKEAVERGVKSLKVKVGEAPDRDVERVKQIRDRVGTEIEIRLDVNQGWRDLWTASKIAKRMERYEVSMLEQPLPAEDLKGCAMLRRHTSLPIMLDESIHCLNDALHAIQLGACDMISVKVMKAGGPTRVKQLVEFCTAHGIPCHMGTSWETEVGWAANLNLIRGLPGIRLWDAYSPTEIYWGTKMSLGSPIHSAVEHGVSFVKVPEGPGLGIHVDETNLAQHLIAAPVRVRKSGK